MIRIGFTGTRKPGMSLRQRKMFVDLIHAFTGVDTVEFHHGDAIGADTEADKIARSFGCKIVIHPPLDPKYQAFCARPEDVVMAPDEYMSRNHHIVDQTEFIIATPRTSKEELRSGTWACIRYARDVTATPIIKIEP